MRIVIAMDSFKGSLSAPAACAAVAKGLKQGMRSVETDEMPVADGGEGFARALCAAAGGEMVSCPAQGPMGNTIQAEYAWLPGNVAAIELAAASGLHLVHSQSRNIFRAHTYGTGQLIAHALSRGAEKILIGLGGSATNDGGLGIFCALGGRILEKRGVPIPPQPRFFGYIHDFDTSGIDSRALSVPMHIASDVQSPLTGREGAAYVFGPQKGAAQGDLAALDGALARIARLHFEKTGKDFSNLPGAGAAGGAGWGLMAFFGAACASGIDTVLSAVNAAARIAAADLVVVGEGNTDGQSAQGKAPCGVARLAASLGKPVLCLSGGLGEGYQALYGQGVAAAFSMAPGPRTLEDMMENAQGYLAEGAVNLGRLIAALDTRKA